MLTVTGFGAPRCRANAQASFNILTAFDDNNLGFIQGGVVRDSAGDLFGTAQGLGANGYGAVYELKAGTTNATVLFSFNNTNGRNPYAGLTADPSGNYFGTTYYGGPNDDGTLFEVSGTGSHAVTADIASFNGSNGRNPVGNMITDGLGNYFGTTQYGGLNGDGNVFEFSSTTHAITTLFSFNGSNGSQPQGSLVMDAQGNLYGTTYSGGNTSGGTVFKLAPGTHTLTTLGTFFTNPSLGYWPYSGLNIDPSGNIYGTTYAGGGATGLGTIFEIPAATQTLTTLVTFNGSNGAMPYNGMIADAAGNLFGTTYEGGATGNNDGTIFEYSPSTGALSTIYTLGYVSGSNPYDALTVDSQGNLYGSTFRGGINSGGTLFEITNSGFVTSVPEPAACASLITTACFMSRRRKRPRTLADQQGNA